MVNGSASPRPQVLLFREGITWTAISSHVHGSPTSKLVHSTLDNHDDVDKGKRCLDMWSERKRSPLFNMFC